MFAGHLGAGLAAKRLAPRVSLGLLWPAALLLDALLGVFVLAGLERFEVPQDLRTQPYLLFTFPLSHGLVAVLGWCAGTYALLGLTRLSTRERLVVAGAVASHFVLDALVHVRGLPLLAEPAIGLGLWARPAVALAVELAIVSAGVALYLRASRAPRARRAAVVVLTGLVAVATVAGSLAMEAPPPTGAAVTWIAQTLVLASLGAWLDRAPRVGELDPTAPPPAA